MKIIDEIINNNKLKKNNDHVKKHDFLEFENNYDSLDNDFGIFKITILGIGGAGCNVVSHMSQTKDWGSNVKMIGVNTDLGSLRIIRNHTNTFLLGKEQFAGTGSGGKPSNGKVAAELDKEKIIKMIEGSDILFLIAGLGKGTGSGATPIIADIAKELNIPSVAIVCTPSVQAEGKIVYQNAHENFNLLSKSATCYTTISNDKILNNVRGQISLRQAYKTANEEISNVINDIVNIVNVPSEINIDFADVRNFLEDSDSFISISLQMSALDYSYDKLESEINKTISNSFSGINFHKTSKVLANIIISDDTPVSITSDIHNYFSKKTNNDEVTIVNGINYCENREVLNFHFLISSTNDGLEGMDSHVSKRSHHHRVSDFLTTKEVQEIKDSSKVQINEEIITKLDASDFVGESTPAIQVHTTSALSLEECERIKKSWSSEDNE